MINYTHCYLSKEGIKIIRTLFVLIILTKKASAIYDKKVVLNKRSHTYIASAPSFLVNYVMKE